MTAAQNYALTFPERKVIFTGEPANPPLPATPLYCYAGNFYRYSNSFTWHECLVSGNYTAIDAVNFSEVTPELT